MYTHVKNERDRLWNKKEVGKKLISSEHSSLRKKVKNFFVVT